MNIAKLGPSTGKSWQFTVDMTKLILRLYFTNHTGSGILLAIVMLLVLVTLVVVVTVSMAIINFLAVVNLHSCPSDHRLDVADLSVCVQTVHCQPDTCDLMTDSR